MCYTTTPGPSGKRVRVLASRVEPCAGRPGELVEIGALGPLVAAGEGGLLLAEVQPEGKHAMTGRDFVNGHRLKVGDQFGVAEEGSTAG